MNGLHITTTWTPQAALSLITHEIETDNTIPFLDTLLERKEDGSVVKVHQKKTHTNQYLAFNSHHPLYQKMGVARTLLKRCEEIVTKDEERKEERNTIKSALNMWLSRLSNHEGGREVKEQGRKCRKGKQQERE